MLRITVIAVLLFALLDGSTSRSTLVYASTNDRAIALVRSAIEKMGGEEKLRSLQSVQIERIGHSYSIEQSERPEGPWLVNYELTLEAFPCRHATQFFAASPQKRRIYVATTFHEFQDLEAFVCRKCKLEVKSCRKFKRV